MSTSHQSAPTHHSSCSWRVRTAASAPPSVSRKRSPANAPVAGGKPGQLPSARSAGRRSGSRGVDRPSRPAGSCGVMRSSRSAMRLCRDRHRRRVGGHVEEKQPAFPAPASTCQALSRGPGSSVATGTRRRAWVALCEPREKQQGVVLRCRLGAPSGGRGVVGDRVVVRVALLGRGTNARTSALWKFTPTAPVRSRHWRCRFVWGAAGQAALNIASSAHSALAATLLTPSAPRPAAELISCSR